MRSIKKVLYVCTERKTRWPDQFGELPENIRRAGFKVTTLDIRQTELNHYMRVLQQFAPDVVFCWLNTQDVLKRMVSFMEARHPVPVFNWCTEEPNFVSLELLCTYSAKFDFWFTIDPKMVKFHKTQCWFIPPGFSDYICRDMGLPKLYDVSYIGNLGHNLSRKMFVPYMKVMAQHNAMLCLEKRLKRAGWYNPPDEFGKCIVINQSKIHVGISRVRGFWEPDVRRLLPDYPLESIGLFYQPKSRTFEAIGSGTLLLNDYYPEIEEMFELGKEIVTYQFGNMEEFADKLAWYIAHDDERIRIARAGWERGQKEHTFRHRIQKMFDIVQKNA